MEKHILKEILEYWYTIEFLNQANFSSLKDIRYFDDFMIKIAEYIYPGTDLAMVANEASSVAKYPETADTIELCIGRVSKDECIKAFYKQLHEVDDRIEKSKGTIALLGLQISSLQRYIAGSVSVSPLIWAISKINKQNIESIATLIDEKAYQKDIEKIDEWLRGKNEITSDILQECFHKCVATYITPFSYQVEIAYNGMLITQRFSDEASKDRNMEVLGYSNLSANYFAKDLQMIKENVIEKGEGSYQSVYDGFLRPYILSAYNQTKLSQPESRIDVIKKSNETKDTYYNQLKIENAPIGKWPSRHAPAFMQQYAINQIVSMGEQKLPAFVSVNGPPGTGKTTLLKEVIADHIVKKALAMCGFESADDAFVEKHFKYGSQSNNGYHKFPTYNHYYEIDLSIHKHSILVASCNNAAVENITKELPDGEALCNNIAASLGDDHSECCLSRLHKDFSIENEEIFFTKYANKLFNNETTNDYYWGLVSLPLGKRGNIKKFARILNEIFMDCMKSNNLIEPHKELYTKAVSNFQIQYKEVSDIQNNLVKDRMLLEKLLATIKDKKEKTKEIRLLLKAKEECIATCQKEIDALHSRLIDLKKCKDHEAKEVEIKEQLVFGKRSEMKDVEADVSATREKIKKLEDARTWIDYVHSFFKKETMRLSEIREYYGKFALLTEMLQSFDGNVEPLEQAVKKAKELYKSACKNVDDCEVSIRISNAQLKLEKAKIEEAIQNISKLEKEILEIKGIYVKHLDDIQNLDDFDKYVALDDSFWEKFFGDDAETRANINLLSPWKSKRYDRQRERLFHCALQVIREFILSSTKARCNIKNIHMMWTHSDGKDIVHYDSRDEITAYPALMQTLMSMIPVISTTFASVQQFLGSNQKARSIGTLIIDEAGQAQPYMALGAMFRANHVVVVGDPNQVEPVVTDELNAIKRILKKESITAYLNKTLSVQGFCDYMNPNGTYFKTGNDEVWVGSPLLVHRRCISPMFEISNILSYDGIMIQQTKQPDSVAESTFCLPYSKWLNIKGAEWDHKDKNHYVENQGEEAIKLIKVAFEKTTLELPSLYLISPFTSVVKGFKNAVKNSDFYAIYKDRLDKWLTDCCGTVHTFQGKEANEVIFLLGCDIDAKHAVRWVNTNIINVAVTRAKYRLCIIADYQVWRLNPHMPMIKGILDAYTIEKLKEASEQKVGKENAIRIQNLLEQVPDVSCFIDTTAEENELYLDNMLKGLEITGFHLADLREEEKNLYHLNDEFLSRLHEDVRKNLITGIKIDGIFRTILSKFQMEVEDHSFLNILFCKTLELQMRDCFINAYKKHFGESYIKGKVNPNGEKSKGAVKIKDAEDKHFMLGPLREVLEKHVNEIACLFNQKEYNSTWWNAFIKDFKEAKDLRNDCCHVDVFSLEEEKKLRYMLFDKKLLQHALVGKKLEHIDTKAKLPHN